jgi:hypothetical protein
MEAPWCVSGDVFSDSTYYWMIYYAYHSGTYFLHYVFVGAFSDSTYYWMTFYTHHRYADAPNHEGIDDTSV